MSKDLTFTITDTGVSIDQATSPFDSTDLIEIAAFAILALEDITKLNHVRIMDNLANLVRRYHKNVQNETSIIN